MSTTLPTPISEYVEAGNSFDGDRLVAAFAPDALVNDNRREFWGTAAIRAWADREIIGDKVTLDVTSVTERHGVFVVTASVDGTFDKSNLPDPLMLTHYFTLSEDRIGSLIIILNSPVES